MELHDYQQISKLTDNQLRNLFGVRDFFIYELDFATLTHATSQQSSFTIQTDSNFLWQEATFVADIADAAYTNSTIPIPNATVLIQDTGSGRQLSSNPVPLSSQFGFDSRPYVLKSPRLFMANSTISVSIANYDAAVDYNVRLQFIGTKLFRFQGQ